MVCSSGAAGAGCAASAAAAGPASISTSGDGAGAASSPMTKPAIRRRRCSERACAQPEHLGQPSVRPHCSTSCFAM
eukprot:12502561-Alexandrium_andersonii.AAC.1